MISVEYSGCRSLCMWLFSSDKFVRTQQLVDEPRIVVLGGDSSQGQLVDTVRLDNLIIACNLISLEPFGLICCNIL
jgi:hypothetical protein